MPRLFIRDRLGRFARAAWSAGVSIMKKITLHGPTVRNDQSYADAGTTLTIGDKPDEIAADRARELVDRGVALSETAAAKPEAKASDPA